MCFVMFFIIYLVLVYTLCLFLYLCHSPLLRAYVLCNVLYHLPCSRIYLVFVFIFVSLPLTACLCALLCSFSFTLFSYIPCVCFYIRVTPPYCVLMCFVMFFIIYLV